MKLLTTLLLLFISSLSWAVSGAIPASLGSACSTKGAMIAGPNGLPLYCDGTIYKKSINQGSFIDSSGNIWDGRVVTVNRNWNHTYSVRYSYNCTYKATSKNNIKLMARLNNGVFEARIKLTVNNLAYKKSVHKKNKNGGSTSVWKDFTYIPTNKGTYDSGWLSGKDIMSKPIGNAPTNSKWNKTGDNAFAIMKIVSGDLIVDYKAWGWWSSKHQPLTNWGDSHYTEGSHACGDYPNVKVGFFSTPEVKLSTKLTPATGFAGALGL